MQNGKPYDGGFPQRLPIFTLSKRFTLQIQPYYTKKTKYYRNIYQNKMPLYWFSK